MLDVNIIYDGEVEQLGGDGVLDMLSEVVDRVWEEPEDSPGWPQVHFIAKSDLDEAEDPATVRCHGDGMMRDMTGLVRGGPGGGRRRGGKAAAPVHAVRVDGLASAEGRRTAFASVCRDMLNAMICRPGFGERAGTSLQTGTAPRRPRSRGRHLRPVQGAGRSARRKS